MSGTIDKFDLAKKHKTYYTAKTKPELVHIEAAPFISICGKGDPSGKNFKDNIEALYSTTYTLKFACKAQNKDFVVARLEALWWFDEGKFSSKSAAHISSEVPRTEWEYRLLIRLPDYIGERDVAQAIEAVVSKKNQLLARQIQLFELAEGQCVQMLHIGPFSAEPETLAAILAFCKERQLRKNGYHHEIYLSDFRKTAPSKLRTILREPVK